MSGDRYSAPPRTPLRWRLLHLACTTAVANTIRPPHTPKHRVCSAMSRSLIHRLLDPNCLAPSKNQHPAHTTAMRPMVHLLRSPTFHPPGQIVIRRGDFFPSSCCRGANGPLTRAYRRAINFRTAQCAHFRRSCRYRIADAD